MINCGSIYLIAKDFEKSVEFYTKLLGKNVTDQNMNRFAIFNISNLCLCIMNGYFDILNPDKVTHKGKSYSQYDDMLSIMKKENSGKMVINLGSDDLRKEYQRIVALGIGADLTEIRYINARMPYYYFSMKDPDENTIEITGAFESVAGEEL